jgi:hypothetical protein
MFNIFSKKSEDNQKDEDTLASISYVIKRGDNNALIDVQLLDYDAESVEALGSLLEILGSDAFYIDTVNIIKNSFTKQNRFDLIVNLFSKVETSIRNKIINSAKERIKDEPCVKPSEMFR